MRAGEMAQFLIALGVLPEVMFNPQHPYGGSQLSETTVLGYFHIFFWIGSHQTFMNRHKQRQNTHTHKQNLKRN